MKRILPFAVIAFFVLFIAACSKTMNSNSSVNSATSLWPLKMGNTWIYQDSSFDANNNVIEGITDSTFITSQITSRGGASFYGINDSLGWFGTGGFIAVDPSNAALYGLDSLNAASPYLFFALAPTDNYLLGSSTNYSNPSCIGQVSLVGFASTYTVNGYSCYRTIQSEKDCNGNTTYAIVYYISPGVGVVRIEEYSVNPNITTNTLYLDYSQTLKSFSLK